MRKLIVSEFVSLDGVIQAPGGKDEDLDGGFKHGGWTWPYWHDSIGESFGAMMTDVDAFLLGRRTYLTHAGAFEPMPAGDPFGDMMNAPKKYVVSRTLEKPTWRNTTIIRDNLIDYVRALKEEPGCAPAVRPPRWATSRATRGPTRRRAVAPRRICRPAQRFPSGSLAGRESGRRTSSRSRCGREPQLREL